MMRFLRGWVGAELTGASPEAGLDRLTRADIPFWDPVRTDELHCTLKLYPRDLKRAQQVLAGAMCTLRPGRPHGFRARYYGLRRRPVLLAGLVLAVVGALFLQNFVWVVTVEGCGTVPQAQILRALEEEGVGFGAWGPEIEIQQLKNRMLVRLPELRWLAVNRDGVIARVLTAEREPAKSPVDRRTVTDLIASRPGVITRVDVYNGFPVVEPGDAVDAGQLLVSGYADWELCTQATRSLGEIYARTRYPVCLVIPATWGQKTPAGPEKHRYALILGRKRINFFSNSSILAPGCDRITERRNLSLPGGYVLPLALEITTLRPYTCTQAPLPASLAKEMLSEFARQTVTQTLVAGEILSERWDLQQQDGCYRLTGEIFCEEMIARTRPAAPFGEDDTIGKTDQRGTN